ncbi:MAG: terminase small subunit [Promethearchaeota archaeon]
MATKKKEKKEKKEKKLTAFERLSDKHKLFVKNYIKNNGNQTRAYMDSYPKAKYATARSKGCELVTKDNVKAAIDEEYAKIWKEKDSEIEKGKTYELIKSLGNSDITDIIDLENGTLTVKDISEIPSEARQWIQSLKYTEKSTETGLDRNIEVKLEPKLKALEMRARVQKMVDPKDDTRQIEVIIKPAIRPDEKEKGEK